MVFGPLVGAYATVLTACSSVVAWAGKLFDTLIVPLSPFTHLLADNKRIISDEWWKSALEKSLGAFKKSYELMLFPFADTLKKTGSGISSWLQSTGRGDLDSNEKSTEFGKDLKGLVVNPEESLRKKIPREAVAAKITEKKSSTIDNISEIPTPLPESRNKGNGIESSKVVEGRGVELSGGA